MSYMFYKAKTFNQDLSRWNTSNVKLMGYMFYGATAMSQPMTRWNVTKDWKLSPEP